jgi:hypothetical protein
MGGFLYLLRRAYNHVVRTKSLPGSGTKVTVIMMLRIEALFSCFLPQRYGTAGHVITSHVFIFFELPLVRAQILTTI